MYVSMLQILMGAANGIASYITTGSAQHAPGWWFSGFNKSSVDHHLSEGLFRSSSKSPATAKLPLGGFLSKNLQHTPVISYNSGG